MALFRSLIAGLRRLFRPSASDRDLDDEVRHFVEMDAAARMQAGATPDQARRAARVAFGGIEATKEEVRGSGWEARVDGLRKDVKYAMRSLRRSRGFTSVALVTLTLGIGATSAMFSVVNGVMLRPLPYVDSDRVVLLWTDDVRRGIHEATTGLPTIEDWRADKEDFTSIAAYRNNSATATPAGGDPERVRTMFAGADVFTLLGVRVEAGRLFSPGEDAAGERVAIVTHAYAERHFPGQAIDRTIRIDGDMSAWKRDARVVRVIGVLPAGWYFPSKDVEIYEPIRGYWRYDEESRSRFDESVWGAVGRLRPGVTAEDAQRSLGAVGKALETRFPHPTSRDFPGFTPNVVPVLDAVADTNLRSALWLLLAVVTFVLLIACVNVANLLLARAPVREREIAVRLAIGASRGRIIRQLLIENLCLAGLAGAGGLALAAAAVKVLVAMAPPGIPRLDELGVDGRAVLFALATVSLSTLAFGFAPAWRTAQVKPWGSLKSAGGAVTGTRQVLRLRGVLVTVECALAMVLLAGAGLLVRSLLNVQAVDPGFVTDHVLVVRAQPPQQPPPGLRGVQVFRYRQSRQEALINRVRALPGVVAAGLVGELMMSDHAGETITFAGEAYESRTAPATQLTSIGVTPGFFDTLGVRLLAGRTLTDDDARFGPTLLFTSEDTNYAGRADATVVNDAFVRRFLPGRNPIGVRFYEGEPGKPFWREIVGVVADMRRQGLERESVPQYYGAAIGGGGDVLVRTAGDSLAMANAVRAALREVEPNIVIVRVSTADEQLGSFSAARRFQAWLLSAFAALALVLAAVGVYGVLRYAVEQRTREIGVRVALGASASAIARLILSHALLLVGTGVVLGTIAALSLTRVLSHWLFGVSATDPATFAITMAALVTAGAIACWLPARRAASVDPMQVLRSE